MVSLTSFSTRETLKAALETLIETEEKHAENAKAAALLEIEQSKRTLIAGLDSLYQERSDEWVDTIVERVLSE